MQNYPIPQADNQPSVQLRWGMGTTDVSVVYGGWNIDDVEIRGLRPPCLADVINNDRMVNIDDLLNVIGYWGQSGIPADCFPPGGNGIVNIDDLLYVIRQWGACP